MRQGREGLVSIDDQKHIISEGLKALKEYAAIEDLEQATRVKDMFLGFIEAHENTLFFIGIGSYGDNVDDFPFIKAFMEDQRIVAHSILVEGRSMFEQRDPNSSFTTKYADYVIGKSYTSNVYDSQKGRYTPKCGTFYSSSLAVVDAYHYAKNYSLYSYHDLRKALLNAEKGIV